MEQGLLPARIHWLQLLENLETVSRCGMQSLGSSFCPMRWWLLVGFPGTTNYHILQSAVIGRSSYTKYLTENPRTINWTGNLIVGYMGNLRKVRMFIPGILMIPLYF